MKLVIVLFKTWSVGLQEASSVLHAAEEQRQRRRARRTDPPRVTRTWGCAEPSDAAEACYRKGMAFRSVS